MIDKALSGVIIGGFVGFLSSYFMWRTQIKYAKKKIALGFYTEVCSLEESLKGWSGVFTHSLPGSNGSSALVEIRQPFYADGIFLDFRKEIFSFDSHLIEELLKFYEHILTAERFRHVDKSDMFAKFLNDAMKDHIIKAYGLVPRLKELLKKEI